MHNIRFVFFGTPEFSVRVLDALEVRGFLPALIVTGPDKPRGRGLEVLPSPVKVWAKERGIDLLQPGTLKDQAIVEALANTDWDIFIVAAYAKLLPQTVLDIPRHGCLNIHPSLLPKFRGASPVISAILADERDTGVSIMQMVGEMDAGPIVAQAKIEIAEEDWPPPAPLLTDLLFTEGGNLLAETLPLWIAGKVAAVPQDEAAATFTRKFNDQDALVDLSAESNQYEQFLKIRAFGAHPPAGGLRAHFFTEKDGKKMRALITEANWKDNTLVIEKVIPEGKKEMFYGDFLLRRNA